MIMAHMCLMVLKPDRRERPDDLTHNIFDVQSLVAAESSIRQQVAVSQRAQMFDDMTVQLQAGRRHQTRASVVRAAEDHPTGIFTQFKSKLKPFQAFKFVA